MHGGNLLIWMDLFFFYLMAYVDQEKSMTFQQMKRPQMTQWNIFKQNHHKEENQNLLEHTT